MPLSSRNSLPFRVGGGPTRFEAAFNSLVSMDGINGTSSDEESLESLWTQAKADGLATLGSFYERAILQISPETATDFIPVYEDILNIPINELEHEQVRRDRITAEYSRIPEAWNSALTTRLTAISSNISILHREFDQITVTQIGRMFEDYAGADPYAYDSPRKCTSFPMYSNGEEIVVLFELGDGVPPNGAIHNKVALITRELNITPPSWVNHQIIHHVGFTLDLSCLDITGFDA